MKIVKEKIDISELKEMAKHMHGNLVKAMVDVEMGIMAVDAPLHSDLLEFLIEKENAAPQNLWGINFYPDKAGGDFLEFDSMMNIKPGSGNMTRGVESKEIQEKITAITNRLVQKSHAAQ